MSEIVTNTSGSELEKEKQKFEESIWAEIVFRASDISCLAKWPLLILAIICWLCSIVAWYAGTNWVEGPLNEGEIAFLESFIYFMNIAFVILVAGLLLCFGIVIASLGIYKFLLKRETYEFRVLTESAGVLLSNSFYFGIALVFAFLTFLSKQGTTYETMKAGIIQSECSYNLGKLYEALQCYAAKNHYHYPAPDKWCDLVMGYAEVTKDNLVFPSAEEGQCHYALNPNTEPLSKYENRENYLESCGYYDGGKSSWPEGLEWQEWIDLLSNYRKHDRYERARLSNVVLLFESKQGWNRYGGPELLAPENHRGKGCNILFNSGRVRFVREEEFPKLKWKPDEAQEE